MTNKKCELTSMDVNVQHLITHSMPPSTTYIQYFPMYIQHMIKLQQYSKFACWSQTNPFLAFDFPYLIFKGGFSQVENVLRTLGLGPKSRVFSSIFVNINIMI
jgi:hypothetical protein